MTPRKRLRVAVESFLHHYPMFANIVLKWELVECDDRPTMATNGRQLFYNPKFVTENTTEENAWVILHEAGHIFLGHHIRLINMPIIGMANISCIVGDTIIRLANGNSIEASSVRVGIRLYTPFGEAIVSRVLQKRAVELVRLRLADGRAIICTADHPIITTGGCCCEANSATGSEVYSVPETKMAGVGNKVSYRELAETYRNADSLLLASHLQHRVSHVEASRSEEDNGWKSREGYIRADFKPSTVAVRLLGSVDGRGGDHNNLGEATERKVVFPASDLRQQHLCVVSAGSRRIRIHDYQNPQHARIAILQGFGVELARVSHNSGGDFTLPYGEKASSGSIVETLPDSIKARLSRTPEWFGRVHGFTGCIEIFERTKVVGIEAFRRTSEVYDFQTDIGCYLANGILVHNCDLALNELIKAACPSERLRKMIVFVGKGEYADFPHGRRAEVYYDRLENPQSPESTQGEPESSGTSGDTDEESCNATDNPEENGNEPEESPDSGNDDGQVDPCSCSGTVRGDPNCKIHGQTGRGEQNASKGQPRGSKGHSNEPGDYGWGDYEGLGDVIPAPDVNSNEEKAAAEGEWQEVVAESVALGQMCGNCPGWFKAKAEEILGKSEIPWTQELRQFLTKVIPKGATFTRPNRRSSWRRDVILPARRSKGGTDGLLIADVSGSIFDQINEAVMPEIDRILISMAKTTVDMVQVDTEVRDVKTFRRYDFPLRMPLDWKGGGGTDLNPGFEYAMKNRARYKWVICVTDFIWPYQEATNPKLPVLWIGVGNQPPPKPKFGRVVKVKV